MSAREAGMFGSAILDVVAGVVFAFLGVSLAASAITEALNSFTKLRQKTLVSGVQSLLNDPDFNGLAKDMFNHALINPLSSGNATNVSSLTAMPAYIESTHFASALLDVVRKRAPGQPLSVAVNAISDPQIKQTLQLLLMQADNDEAKLQASIGSWFDSSMERVSGVYKRNTQIIAFGVALGAAVLMNVDALHISKTLWERPVLTQGLTAGTTVAAPARSYLDRLEQSTLIGWDSFAVSERNPFGTNRTLAGVAGMLLGWLVVAGASLFGAPFWFDTLQQITQLRGVGGGAGVEQRASGPTTS
jgi:hypothetical protein